MVFLGKLCSPEVTVEVHLQKKKQKKNITETNRLKEVLLKDIAPLGMCDILYCIGEKKTPCASITLQMNPKSLKTTHTLSILKHHQDMPEVCCAKLQNNTVSSRKKDIPIWKTQLKTNYKAFSHWCDNVHQKYETRRCDCPTGISNLSDKSGFK